MPTEWKRERVEFHGSVTYAESVTVGYSYYEYVVVEETSEWVRFIAFNTDEMKEVKFSLAYSLSEDDCKDLAEQFGAFVAGVRSR
jgi:hypothetical protein